MESPFLGDLFRLPSRSPSKYNSKQLPENFNAERLRQYNASRQEQSSITIVTAEGDKVTINKAFSEQTNAMTYDRFARTSDGQLKVHADSLNYSRTDQFAFSVEGDLNEQELRDIRKALNMTDRLMPQMARGDMDALGKSVEKFASLSTLSSLDASYQYSEQIQVSEYAAVEASREETSKAETNRAECAPGRGNCNGRANSLDGFYNNLERQLDSADLDRAGPEKLRHLQKRLDHLLDRLLGDGRESGRNKMGDLFKQLKDSVAQQNDSIPVVSTIAQQSQTPQAEAAA